MSFYVSMSNVDVILFEIDRAIFYTNLHQLLIHKLNKLSKFL